MNCTTPFVMSNLRAARPRPKPWVGGTPIGKSHSKTIDPDPGQGPKAWDPKWGGGGVEQPHDHEPLEHAQHLPGPETAEKGYQAPCAPTQKLHRQNIHREKR
jgi:hypothetical protein